MQSYANAIVSSAEDPEKLLDQTVLEMNEDLIKMRQASAQVLVFPYTMHILWAWGLRKMMMETGIAVMHLRYLFIFGMYKIILSYF